MRVGIPIAFALALFAPRAFGEEAIIVTPQMVADEKAVFATVESANVIPARARIGGTVVELAAKKGDHVAQDQVVAIVADQKLALQLKSLDAQISGLQAQLDKARMDLAREQELFARGTAAKAALDTAQTAFDIATNSLKSRVAERSVVEQQVTEGKVFAPTAGRVLTVPVTTGTVIMAGEPVATIAEQNFVLRLRVPERHARFLKVGDPVRIDGEDLGKSGVQFGSIRLVYPQIEDGRVIADAAVAGHWRLFRRSAHPRMDFRRGAHQHHRAGLVYRNPVRHRLCPRPQGHPNRDRRAGAARAGTATAGHAGCA